MNVAASATVNPAGTMYEPIRDLEMTSASVHGSQVDLFSMA